MAHHICHGCGREAGWVAIWQRPGGPVRNMGVPEGQYERRRYCGVCVAAVVVTNDPPREVRMTRAEAQRRKQAADEAAARRRTRDASAQLLVPGTDLL